MSKRLHERALGVLNRVYLWKSGGEKRPVFYESVEGVCPELAALTAHWEEIRDEIEAVLARRAPMVSFRDDELAEKPVRMPRDRADGRGWGIIFLYMMGEKPEGYRRLMPRTTALIDRVPGLWQVQVSVLAAGKSIPAHTGQYAGYLRYHLGIRIPEVDPPRLRVRDEWYAWSEGEGVVFDDMWDHEVVNECAEERVVLMVDVLRPMGGVVGLVNRFVTWQIVRRVFAKRMMRRLGDWDEELGAAAAPAAERAAVGVG